MYSRVPVNSHHSLSYCQIVFGSLKWSFEVNNGMNIAILPISFCYWWNKVSKFGVIEKNLITANAVRMAIK